MIGIVLPSRGLINVQTVEWLWFAGPQVSTSLYLIQGLPIPDCFNVPCQEALDDGCEYVMIIEDDIKPPYDALPSLVAALKDADIAFYDYNLEQGSVTAAAGEAITSGTGCIMFKAEVLKALMPFSIERLYDKQGQVVGTNDGTVYGRQDTDMFIRAHQAGYKVKCVGRARHFHVKEYGKPRVNNGCHQIVEL